MSSRRFVLKRLEDVHGNSGVGNVAEGTEYSNGSVSLTWITPHWSGTWFMSIHEVKTLHSHGGKTKLCWVDPPNINDLEEIVPKEEINETTNNE